MFYFGIISVEKFKKLAAVPVVPFTPLKRNVSRRNQFFDVKNQTL
jgi:hypothetical protein